MDEYIQSWQSVNFGLKFSQQTKDESGSYSDFSLSGGTSICAAHLLVRKHSLVFGGELRVSLSPFMN